MASAVASVLVIMPVAAKKTIPDTAGVELIVTVGDTSCCSNKVVVVAGFVTFQPLLPQTLDVALVLIALNCKFLR